MRENDTIRDASKVSEKSFKPGILEVYIYIYMLFDGDSLQQGADLSNHITTCNPPEALHRYASDIYRYINAVCDHQEQREIGLSTIEGYIERRLQTIGAYPCITIME
jgi:hypothetical protein